jgi:hypothetical protein
MSKGYAEGPAAEEHIAELERKKRTKAPLTVVRGAVFASTDAQPKSHFIGWADEVDQDKLFSSGKAYGLKVRSIPA